MSFECDTCTCKKNLGNYTCCSSLTWAIALQTAILRFVSCTRSPANFPGIFYHCLIWFGRIDGNGRQRGTAVPPTKEYGVICKLNKCYNFLQSWENSFSWCVAPMVGAGGGRVYNLCPFQQSIPKWGYFPKEMDFTPPLWFSSRAKILSPCKTLWLVVPLTCCPWNSSLIGHFPWPAIQVTKWRNMTFTLPEEGTFLLRVLVRPQFARQITVLISTIDVFVILQLFATTRWKVERLVINIQLSGCLWEQFGTKTPKNCSQLEKKVICRNI